MKHLPIVFLILIAFSARGQLQVQFRECITCDTHGQEDGSVTYQYKSAMEYKAIEVADDYGVRREGDKWHGGVDYNSQEENEGGAGDRGDLIIAIEGGEISGILDAGYKRLFVDGSHDFGYGHLFWGSQSSTQSGGCYLRENIEFENRWAIVLIIDGDTTAIGPVLGQVIFSGDTLEVQNTISAGDPIGPTGGSSNGNELGPHLHLYNNPDGSSSINDEITKNPLQYVDYSDTTIEVKILKENDMDEGITLSYPGTNFSTIQVRSVLKGQPTDVKRYPKILDTDQVDILMNNFEQDTFSEIIGPNFRSELCLGGRLGGPERYPRNADGSGYSPWYNTENQWNRTGVHPYAYRGDGKADPWDDFYFADFVSRIHKDDIAGDGTLEIADLPSHARYNDGPYEFKAVVTDVRGNEHEGPLDASGNLMTVKDTLDNFMPFIKKVELYVNNDLIYSFNSKAIDNDLTTPGDGYINPGPVINNATLLNNPNANNIELIVTASEPLKEVDLLIEPLMEDFRSYSSVNEDRTEFTLSLSDVEEEQVLQYADCYGWSHFIGIRGKDYSGNRLMPFRLNERQTKIPLRVSTTGDPKIDWKPHFYAFDDVFKFFCIKECEEPGVNKLLGGNCDLNIEELIVLDASPTGDSGAIYLDFDSELVTNITFFSNHHRYGGVIKSGLDDYVENLSAGIYCYEIELGCCSISNCVEVKECEERELALASVPLACDGEYIDVTIAFTSPVFEFISNDYHVEWSDGQEGPSATLLAGEEYTVTVSNKENGCEYSENVTIDPLQELSIEAEISNARCNKNGTIDLQISGPYTSILWEDNKSNDSIRNDLEPGDYCVEVASTHCNYIKCFTIELIEDNILIAEVQDFTCYSKGSIELTLPPNYPISIKWLDNQSSNLIRNDLDPGEYCVEVTSTNCTYNRCFTIELIEENILDAEVQNYNCDTKGAIQLDITGAYDSIKWLDDHSSDLIRSNLDPDEYCVEVATTYCTHNKCFTIKDETSDFNVVLESITSPSCWTERNIDCDAAIDISVLGSQNYTVMWVTPENDTLYSEDATDLCPGIHKLIVRTANGCGLNRVYKICCCEFENGDVNSDLLCPTAGESGPGFTVEVDYQWPTNRNSYDGWVRLLGIPNDPSIIISWYDENGNLIKSGQNPNLNGLGKGIYCYEVNVSGCNPGENGDIYDSGCVELNTCADVVSSTPIMFEITNTCPNQSYGILKATLDYTTYYGPYEYIWSNLETNQEINQLAAGEYCVTITDKNDCVYTDCVEIQETKNFDITYNYDCIATFSCNGNDIDSTSQHPRHEEFIESDCRTDIYCNYDLTFEGTSESTLIVTGCTSYEDICQIWDYCPINDQESNPRVGRKEKRYKDHSLESRICYYDVFCVDSSKTGEPLPCGETTSQLIKIQTSGADNAYLYYCDTLLVDSIEFTMVSYDTIDIVPNPFKEEFVISFNGNANYTILSLFDINGTELNYSIQRWSKKNRKIKLLNNRRGIIFIQVLNTTTNEIFTKKLYRF